jgi:hypothetical protein
MRAVTSALFAATDRSRFVLVPAATGFGFHLEVLDDGAWRRVTALDNPLVSGATLDLRPADATATGDALTFSGSGPCPWRGTVRPVPGTDWFHVEVIVSSGGFRIGDRSVEPQITIDLGELPPYERGDHVWFKTLVQNPTQWNGEGRGNDFPALYYYDPYLKTAFRMFFDMTAMSWMGADTIARFYSYRCGFRRRYDGRPSAEIGLLAETQSGHAFPAGEQVFSWYVAAEQVSDEPAPPTEQDALDELVRSCAPLLRPSAGHWSGGSLNWRDIADGCAAELMNTEHCWARDEQGEFLLAYVDGRSDAWAVTMKARGREHRGIGPCLEAALWALFPLDVLRSSAPDGRFADLRRRLEAFVRAELRRDRCSILSGVSDTTAPMGTWQYLYMLAQVWFIFARRDDRDMMARINAEIESVAIPLAANTQYLFPLQFDKRTLRKIGPGSNYAAAGTYALLMADLAARTGEVRYLTEVGNALRALGNVPIDDAVQEVVLMAHAVEAADRLHRLAPDQQWARLRRYFQAQTLRMMYWYDDRTSDRTGRVSHLGMFLACANIGYPAFFENIETAARLASVAESEADPVPLLRVLDHGRRANFAFFPRCSPDMYGPMPLEFIPFEEVPILEGPNDAGFLGQEIYGAGFSFLAHLLWDACATSADRDVMVLNVRPYGTVRPDARTWEGSFLVFNSKDEPVHTSITFPISAAGDRVAATVTTPEGEAAGQDVDERGLPLRLGPGGWARLRVTVTRRAA